jgi:hypothetical protein
MSGPIPDAKMHRRVASQCNDRAWTLIEKAELNAGECTDLVRFAATASYHWKQIGTESNIAHADLLLSWAFARIGASALAVQVASRAYEYFSQNQSEEWEKAFAHAAMAIALHGADDLQGHRRHYQEARLLEDKLTPGDLNLFQSAFRNVPRP